MGEGEIMPIFSVIIPAYNCEKYLADAVESVRKQPVKEIEIIIVDDGSTDSTGRICDSLARQEAFIRVIHQENQGASAARNAGIRRAEGEYILFLDADDIYVENAIDNDLLEECAKGYDVIICSSLTSNVDRDRYGIDMKVREGRFAGGQAFPISGHFAACLYKRKLLLDNDILFDEGIRLNEDEAFKMKAMYAAALIRTKEKFLYTYCVTPGSVRYTDTHIYDFVEAWTKTYQWLEKHGAGGNVEQAKAFVRQKIVSRQLLYAKLYVQQGHGVKELEREMERIGALETLKMLPAGYMIPTQRAELALFQESGEKFVEHARKEGWKIRAGRMLLKVRWIRRMRDRRKFPMREADMRKNHTGGKDNGL